MSNAMYTSYAPRSRGGPAPRKGVTRRAQQIHLPAPAADHLHPAVDAGLAALDDAYFGQVADRSVRPRPRATEDVERDVHVVRPRVHVEIEGGWKRGAGELLLPEGHEAGRLLLRAGFFLMRGTLGRDERRTGRFLPPTPQLRGLSQDRRPNDRGFEEQDRLVGPRPGNGGHAELIAEGIDRIVRPRRYRRGGESRRRLHHAIIPIRAPLAIAIERQTQAALA